MYVFQHTGQLSIEEFHSPFGGKLDPNNRWVLLHKVIPWMSLESHDAPQFTTKTGAPAKPFQRPRPFKWCKTPGPNALIRG
jgi:hypothetical protein